MAITSRYAALGAAIAAVAVALPAAGGRLAVRTFTVADGLAGDQVSCIVRDRVGFLWIGTRTGLSRFDGASFRSFDTRDGLPHPAVHAVLETADGELWCGTGGGLVRMRAQRAADGRAFDRVEGIAGGVSALAQDVTGQVWATSGGDLFRCSGPTAGRCTEVELALPFQPGRGRAIEALAAASDGSLWLGSSVGLHRLLRDGTLLHYRFGDTDAPWRIQSLLLESSGRLLVPWKGLVVLEPEAPDLARKRAGPSGVRRLAPVSWPGPARSSDEALLLDQRHLMTTEVIFGLAEADDGAVWAATHLGLHVIGDGASVVCHDSRTGLGTDHFGAVLVDEVGNVWAGTQSQGLIRVSAAGFTSFTQAEGLTTPDTASVTLGPAGEVVVVGIPPEGHLHLLEGERFVPLAVRLPKDVPRRGWGLNQVSFFDHRGRLWVPTPRGLFRFGRATDLRALPGLEPERRYLPDSEVFRLFEDSRGDLWLGVFDGARLQRWERQTDTLHAYGPEDGIPHQAGTAFTEDRSGAVWIGFYAGGLARWRNGAFTVFDARNGVPRGFVNCLLVDSSGRLWVGAQADGLAVTEDPTVDAPSWRRLTNADGLASEAIFSLAEDQMGRIYAGSLKGVDRLDPSTGRVQHFDTSEGLVNNLVVDALVDAQGDVWFATGGGVSRYRPEPERWLRAPNVVIDRLTVDGTDLALPLRGVDRVPRTDLPARTEVVAIGFAAVDLTPGGRIEFDVASGPKGDGEWSSVGGARSVRLAGLSAGRHTVSIRARLPDGSVGPPATVELDIDAPFWRRWWFVVSIATFVAATTWTVHHWRIRRLEELERVRSRIAADLHDELGLSLVRVAILADLAGQSARDDAVSRALRDIGGTARDLVDATSDMAWALDPRHDTVADAVARLRRLAGEVVEGSGARFRFEADSLEGMPMGSEARRHLLLILKEAVRNACRHGRPSAVTVTVRRLERSMVLTVEDDGVGFEPATGADGQGLASMRRRAEAMGAALTVDSSPGGGTRVRLELGLDRNA